MKDASGGEIPKRSVKKQKFTPEEDKKLLELIKTYGLFDWESISDEMPNRTPRQCRDRWNYYLNPDVRTNEWTEEEDKLLLKKYEKYGPKWSKIAQFFDNRTDVNIKNHYIVLERRKAKQINLTRPEALKQIQYLNHIENPQDTATLHWLDNQYSVEF